MWLFFQVFQDYLFEWNPVYLRLLRPHQPGIRFTPSLRKDKRANEKEIYKTHMRKRRVIIWTSSYRNESAPIRMVSLAVLLFPSRAALFPRVYKYKGWSVSLCLSSMSQLTPYLSLFSALWLTVQKKKRSNVHVRVWSTCSPPSHLWFSFFYLTRSLITKLTSGRTHSLLSGI